MVKKKKEKLQTERKKKIKNETNWNETGDMPIICAEI